MRTEFQTLVRSGWERQQQKLRQDGRPSVVVLDHPRRSTATVEPHLTTQISALEWDACPEREAEV